MHPSRMQTRRPHRGRQPSEATGVSGEFHALTDTPAASVELAHAVQPHGKRPTTRARPLRRTLAGIAALIALLAPPAATAAPSPGAHWLAATFVAKKCQSSARDRPKDRPQVVPQRPTAAHGNQEGRS